jgi:hypothetical protein
VLIFNVGVTLVVTSVTIPPGIDLYPNVGLVSQAENVAAAVAKQIYPEVGINCRAPVKPPEVVETLFAIVMIDPAPVPT